MRETFYFLRCAFLSMIRSPFVQLIAVGTLGIASLVLSVFLALLVNLDMQLERFDRDDRLLVFLAEDHNDAALNQFCETLKSWPEVTDAFGRSRAFALQELKVALNDETLLDGVSSDVLPASLEIKLARTQVERSVVEKATIKKLESLQGLGKITEIQGAHPIVQRLQNARGYLTLGGLGLFALVAFALVFIVSSTINLTLFARRDEIEIMELVGATHRFIRVPCYFEGALQGALGAGVGLCLFWAIFRGLELDKLGALELVFLPPWMMAVILLAAVGVGAIGSHLAVSRYLQRTL